MSFSVMTNLATMILCLAVIVQSARMMRSLRTVKNADLGGMISALDMSTARAHAVLSDLKALLGGDVVANAKMLERAEEIRDELSVMVDIADASAERIMAAASSARATPARGRKAAA
jgi:hypothetical protein